MSYRHYGDAIERDVRVNFQKGARAEDADWGLFLGSILRLCFDIPLSYASRRSWFSNCCCHYIP